MIFFAAGAVRANVYVFNPLVGDAVALDHTDGTGTNARFFNPTAAAIDSAGNIYIADGGDHTVRKVTAGGVVTTIAGASGEPGSADGVGTNAQFLYPYAVAVDGSGNVYVTDIGNQNVRKITAGGVVTTLAGTLGIAGSLNGSALAAQFNLPQGIAVDTAGNVYVSDTNNDMIRVISASGVVTTLAGAAGQSGNSDGTGASARFNNPEGIAMDAAGNLYVADFGNSTIRKIAAGATVTTLAGSSAQTGSADGENSAAQFNHPSAVSLDGAGNVYVIDTSNQTVRKITAGGIVSTLAGSPGLGGRADGAGAAASFFYPAGIAANSAGTVYVADTGNHALRVVTSAGVVSTLAGAAGVSGNADGTGAAALFGYPYGVAIDSSGNVYIADHNNDTIRKMTPAGAVTTFAGAAGIPGSANGVGGAARFNGPTGVAVDGAGNVYVADSGNMSIRKITAGGIVTTFVGYSGVAGSSDGLGAIARFNAPQGVAVDGSGNVYVADTNNNTIRKVTTGGTVTTLAGAAGQTGSFDGLGGAARFDAPYGVAVDGAGNVYVADFFNATIRKITPGGTVTTLAGLAGRAGMADGAGNAARFNQPYGVAVDGSGNVLVADTYNRSVREVTAGGVVTTLSGANARFYYPQGVALDNAGDLLVADGDNQSVAEGALVAPPASGGSVGSSTVTVGQNATFTVGSAVAQTTYQWQVSTNAGGTWTSLGNNSTYGGTTTVTLSVGDATMAMNGDSYRAELSNAAGTSFSGTATLTVDASALPVFTTQPQSQTVATGSTVVFNVTTGGTRSTYQWYLNGAAIAGATDSILVVQATAAGAYTCVATNASGSVLSNASALTVAATTNPGRLTNLSINTAIPSGNQQLTLGFVIGGAGTTGSENLLIRVTGPALATLLPPGVTPMPDPQLTVFNSANISIDANSGWASTSVNEAAVTSADSATYAFPLTNPTSKDSAIVVSLAPNSLGYTVEIGSVSGTAGTILAELYDDTSAYTTATPHLISLSCKLQVVQNGTLTEGFTIGGSTSKTVLIRAGGPSLAPYVGPGVALMPDPRLNVFNTANEMISSNAGWAGDPQIAAAAQAVYAYAFSGPTSADSAVLMTLAPGNYTVQASSVSGTTGTTLMEVYEIP
jgi:sugar lactone lactonase YvrE